MKKIRQRHRTGCSVASLAMLLGISYNAALKALHPDHKPYQVVSADMEQISKALQRMQANTILHINLFKLLLGDSYREIHIKDMKNPAILCIYQKDVHNANHAVVWDPDSQKVLDPGRKKNLPVNYYQRRLSFAFELQ